MTEADPGSFKNDEARETSHVSRSRFNGQNIEPVLPARLDVDDPRIRAVAHELLEWTAQQEKNT